MAPRVKKCVHLLSEGSRPTGEVVTLCGLDGKRIGSGIPSLPGRKYARASGHWFEASSNRARATCKNCLRLAATGYGGWDA